MSCLIFEGQLMKKGKLNKAWKNRWCSILYDVNGSMFFEYYNSKIDNNLCGSIIMSQIFGIEVVHYSDYDLSIMSQIPDHCVITDKIKSKYKYSFLLITANRKYYFAAFDPKNFVKWLSILNKFVYGGIVKQGWLQKRGGKNTAWKRRYFVLNQYKQIKYYVDEQKKSFAGSISLNDITSIKNGEVVHNAKGRRYTFQLNTDKRIWILCANELKSRRSWTEEIEKCRKHRLLTEEIKKEEKEDDDEDGIDIFDVKDKIYQMCSSGDDQSEIEVEEYQCSGCGRIYASQWLKCPGCEKRGTHIERRGTHIIAKLQISPP